MRSHEPRVRVHVVLVASLRDEAASVAAQLPVGRAHLCLESADLPAIVKRILTEEMDH